MPKKITVRKRKRTQRGGVCPCSKVRRTSIKRGGGGNRRKQSAKLRQYGGWNQNKELRHKYSQWRKNRLVRRGGSIQEKPNAVDTFETVS